MKKSKHELIIILTLSLIFILLLFLAQRYPNTYRNNLGFLEIVLNFINFCLLPFTLFFTGKNYFNQRNQKRLDAENIDLTLRLRNDDTTPAYHITIPRYLCSRQEIKGILSDRCRGNYNIPYLSEPAFFNAIVAARSGDSNQLTIYIDARDELGKFTPLPPATNGGSTWFISRHQGAIDWIKTQSEWHIDHYLTHLDDPAIIQNGDTVLGTLPIHIAAAVCARGAHYYFLQLPQEAAQRGSEYSAADMAAMGCTLRRYHIKALCPNQPENAP